MLLFTESFTPANYIPVIRYLLCLPDPTSCCEKISNNIKIDDSRITSFTVAIENASTSQHHLPAQ